MDTETFEMDGYWEDDHGDEHYWHCEEPATSGNTYCLRHAVTEEE